MNKPTARWIITLLTPTLLATASFAELADGEHRVERVIGQRTIKVRTTIRVTGACENPSSWTWGADQECPRSRIASLRVVANASELLIPASAYVDLAAPRVVSIEPKEQGFSVDIQGGDASTGYRASLEFATAASGAGSIVRRTVRSGAFPDEVWETTEYHHFAFDDSEAGPRPKGAALR